MVSTWAAIFLGIIVLLPTIIEFIHFRLEVLGGSIINEDEPRYKYIVALAERFKDQWLFGEGFLSDVNFQFHPARQGAANWYHMMIPQIIGSFGVVGVIAYSYQFFGRISLIFKRVDRTSLALGLSYLGILLMPAVFGFLAQWISTGLFPAYMLLMVLLTGLSVVGLRKSLGR